MSTQNARAIGSLLDSELGEEAATSRQQQQQLVDDATMQVAPEMNVSAKDHQLASGGGGEEAGQRREDGNLEEAGLMNSRVGGQVAERRPWSGSEDAAITRMVGYGSMGSYVMNLVM